MACVIVIIILLIFVLLYATLKMIFRNVKMSDSDTSFYYTPSSDDDFYEDIDGGLLESRDFLNVFGTCYIDCILNSIANSDALVRQLTNEIPAHLSITTISNAFDTPTPLCNINIKPTHDNYTSLSRLLVALYIYGMNDYDDITILTIRTYIMYVENMERFLQKYPKRDKLKPVSFDSPFETLANIDHNFNVYMLLCQRAANKKHTIIASGVKDHRLLERIGIKTYCARCNVDDIANVLSTCDDHDVFVNMLSFRGNLFDQRFDVKTQNGYTLTDMMISRYSSNGNSFDHSMYYDFLKQTLQSDNTKTQMTIDDLVETKMSDGECVVTLLHFQRL